MPVCGGFGPAKSTEPIDKTFCNNACGFTAERGSVENTSMDVRDLSLEEFFCFSNWSRMAKSSSIFLVSFLLILILLYFEAHIFLINAVFVLIAQMFFRDCS